MKPGTIATAAPRLGWRDAVATLRTEPTHARVLGGSIIMLLGSICVSVFNFGYNIAVARLLGPIAFGHVAAVGTLLMLVSAITLSYQLVCAKLIARSETASEKSAVFHALSRQAWTVGLVLGSALALMSGFVSSYLNLPSRHLVMILAVGLTFYVPLGVRRGGFQGTCVFRHLSANLILETVIKLIGALLLIETGKGVDGAIAAVSLSVILAYFFPRIPAELRVHRNPKVHASFGEGVQAIVFFAGQVIINNVDILLVKHFFTNDMAGLYAAIALVGRVLYLASWSVVSAMFPVSAGADSSEKSESVLVVPLAIVLILCLVFIVGLTVFPEPVLRATFGSAFQMHRDMYSLLSLRAAATATYCLAVVLMAYEMSRKIANTGWMQLGISVAIVVAIYLFHSSLHEVIVVQLVLMVVLLMIVSLPFFRNRRNSAGLREAA